MNEMSRGARRQRAFRSASNEGGTARGGHAIMISMDQAPNTTAATDHAAGAGASSDNSVVANVVTDPGAAARPVTPNTRGPQPPVGSAAGPLGRWIGRPLFWIVAVGLL